MSTFWKIFIGFWVIWLIWYWTGGPQRTTNVKPYLKYNYDTTQIQHSGVDLETGAREMLPKESQINSGVEIIENNLNNPSFTQPIY
ncbi:MAG: hypothetical protein PHQ01_04375 [Candidatus Pacebacteria bacterium]|nr:hypothetical protein [Candidatus Paceibacterota bacterium]